MSFSNDLDQILALSNPLATLNSYFGQLHPASWRSVSFFVDTDTTEAGRRNVEHLYPFRDTPWMEDVGRAARVFQVVGFLVGDDVIAQRDKMIAAAEQHGSGTLVHPTFGTLTVSLADKVKFVGDKTHGRKIAVIFTFEEAGKKLYPSQGVSTTSSVTSAATAANQATGDDFVSSMVNGIKAGANAATQALRTVSSWVATAETLGDDASNIFHLASTMTGSFGRFFGGNTGSGIGSIIGGFVSPSQVASQVANLINTGTAARVTLSKAADSVLDIAGDL